MAVEDRDSNLSLVLDLDCSFKGSFLTRESEEGCSGMYV
jgi:hypothetical protein